MRRVPNIWTLLPVRHLLLLLGFLFFSLPAPAEKSDAEWPIVGQNLANHGNQRDEKEIGTDNVNDLKKIWQFEILSGISVNGLGVSGQPTISDGIANFADANGVTVLPPIRRSAAQRPFGREVG